MRKWMVGVLALWMALSGAGALAEEAPAPAATVQPYGEAMDGSLRVLLQSLGSPTALGLTLEGTYSVDGDRGFQFDPGTEIALGLSGGHIVLKVGGATIDMGSGFTLTRHLDASGKAGGAYIHEAEKNTLYNGDIFFGARSEGIRVIVTMHIEEYLYGVVPYEMSDTFPIEALKAQAVAARTYAMQRKARRAAEDYDVVDTTNDQVFKGYDSRYEAPIRAVDETRGVVGMYNGSYAECFYSASNGGQTALANDVWGEGDFGYLDIRDDPYDLENPESMVRTAMVSVRIEEMQAGLKSFLQEEVQARLAAEGKLAEGEAVTLTELVSVEAVEPVYGGGSRQYGAIRFAVKAAVRRLTGDENDLFRMLGEEEPLRDPLVVDLSYYDQVRTALGIGLNSQRYDLVTVEKNDDGYLFTARRYGHGVGLSQRGAQQMAGQHGKTYQEILAFYYPGMQIVRMDWKAEALTVADALPESLGYAAPRPTAAPTPAPLPPLAPGEAYAVVTVEGVDSTLNVRSEPSMDGELVGVLRNGARLIVQSETEDGWAKMKTAELDGYVLMTFIEKE